MEVKVYSLEDTEYLAKTLAKICHKNICLLLKGELAAGKTTFTKYLLHYLGVIEDVTSPTFIIMNQYQGAQNLKINHMDCYRIESFVINNEQEMYLEQFEDSMNIIEWPDIISPYLDKRFVIIKMEIIVNENSRLFTITSENNEILVDLEREIKNA